MQYDVTLREIPKKLSLTIRFTTNMDTISQDMENAYGEIWALMQKTPGTVGHDFFAIYHDEFFDPNKIDVECAISIEHEIPTEGRVVCREVEGGLMAVTVHKGPYHTLEPAYNAVLGWISENGYKPLPKMRDHYLNSPAEVPPEELLTEVLWPVGK